MSRNNIIVVAVAIVLIIICIVIGARKNNSEIESNVDSKQEFKDVSYNKVTNETTGEDEYIVYDKETGVEKTRVENEYQLKIYELDPNYEELPVPKEDDMNSEDMQDVNRESLE